MNFNIMKCVADKWCQSVKQFVINNFSHDDYRLDFEFVIFQKPSILFSVLMPRSESEKWVSAFFNCLICYCVRRIVFN